jgi:perosamine synthetase
VTDQTTLLYLDAVRREFALLKQTSASETLKDRSLMIAEGAGLLLPVCWLRVTDDCLVSTLARWRANNQLAFATRFPVSEEGTRHWLRSNVLEREDRILFLVCEPTGHPVGHIGLANVLNENREMEVDNVLRGEKASPGLMSGALRKLCEWARARFSPSRFYLRVLSDNEHAVDFYRRLGWKEDEREPLTKEVEGEREILRPASAGEPVETWYIRMVYE